VLDLIELFVELLFGKACGSDWGAKEAASCCEFDREWGPGGRCVVWFCRVCADGVFDSCCKGGIGEADSGEG
jgi:hypothetical protein